jgi:hypothetical protein
MKFDGRKIFAVYAKEGKANLAAFDIASGNETDVTTGNQAVATRLDASWAVKNGTFAGTTTAAAKPGDVVILWGTGFGPTTPPVAAGIQVPGDKIYNSNPVTIKLGTTDAQRMGIDYRQGRSTVSQTARGPISAYIVNLAQVQVGDIAFANVPGLVLEGGLPVGIRVSKRGFSRLGPPRVLTRAERPEGAIHGLAEADFVELEIRAVVTLGPDRLERRHWLVSGLTRNVGGRRPVGSQCGYRLLRLLRSVDFGAGHGSTADPSPARAAIRSA